MIEIRGDSLGVDAVAAIAAGAQVSLGSEARARMIQNHRAWLLAAPMDILARKEAWLVGSADHVGSSRERVASFVRSHCAGVGEPLPDAAVRALLAVRANQLACGRSGVRPEVVELLLAMLNAGVHPVVPSQGSVGAAGDLAPLAHLARVALRLGGRARRGGAELDAAAAMQGLPELEVEPKEALSLINGAALTTALGALAVARARRLLLASEVGLAMSLEVAMADAGCLDERALAARGHPGAVAVAARVRELLAGSQLVREHGEADAFSLRCAPAVHGAAWDALHYVERVVEQELNGACDNPLLIDDRVVEAGNFHGAPVALALDHLKVALTQVASIGERRVYRLTYGKLSGNLPSFLMESSGVVSGFMLAQYTAASLVSECKGLAHPASVDSIPTGQHHEDHVPMGPIAARTLLSILENLAAVVAIEVLVAAQGLDFRREGLSFTDAGERVVGPPVALAAGVAAVHQRVRGAVPRWTDDRVLHRDLSAVIGMVRAGDFSGGGQPW